MKIMLLSPELPFWLKISTNQIRKGNHSRQEVVERLGKVLWIDPEDQMKGIFNSPARGLVHYDLSRDCFTEVSPSDERLAGVQIKKEEICLHASFGSTYLFFIKFHLLGTNQPPSLI